MNFFPSLLCFLSKSLLNNLSRNLFYVFKKYYLVWKSFINFCKIALIDIFNYSIDSLMDFWK